MIIIPMAGLSSRFYKAGYVKPKYMLEANGNTLFAHSVNSFKKYFSTELFIFVIRDVCDTNSFVIQQLNEIGVLHYKIIVLENETRGQAETVYESLKNLPRDESITIFNIDTFRPNFIFPDFDESIDGYLEVFIGDGENWSFAKTENENSTKVIETAEKRKISNYCCTGLYYFKTIESYLDSYLKYIDLPFDEWEKGELYIAPLYNSLIRDGKNIHVKIINREDVIFCGVPEEYLEFKKDYQDVM
ncbi:glycosyltransferase family 2 protein [Vibrio vulnificus]|nr:glycosyltransferase family 2 protein [Vibrio vulnificus]EIZ1360372.1 glycosyltransferase family 2 protein [Vibrio vulnificus]